MTVVTTDIPKQMNEELKLLVAVGLYKSKSEALRDAIRNLTFKYQDKIITAKQVRERIDESMKDKSLSKVVDEMRDEEMH